MKPRLDDATIALRAAREFEDGSVVNLGIGIPGLCASFVPEGKRVIFHSENGVLGFGRVLTEGEEDEFDINLINASAQFISRARGMSFFDHATSFGMVRGGHIDVTVLGGLQVSAKGDLANWRAPGRSGGMGGAMDLASGARKTIVTMTHVTGDGQPKMVEECTYPLTARQCVNLVITDVAVIEVTREGLLLKELAPGWGPEEVQAITEPRLTISGNLQELHL